MKIRKNLYFCNPSIMRINHRDGLTKLNKKMATRIRLARHGRKKQAFYHIVVADQRAPRNGKFIEKLGVYNPNTNPATIKIDFDSALKWLLKGAQPSDTARALLSYKGIMMMKHLMNGVAKGAFDKEEAEKRFNLWNEEKENRVADKRTEIQNLEKANSQANLEAERTKNKARAESIAKRLTESESNENETNTEAINEDQEKSTNNIKEEKVTTEENKSEKESADNNEEEVITDETKVEKESADNNEKEVITDKTKVEKESADNNEKKVIAEETKLEKKEVLNKPSENKIEEESK